MTDDDWIKEGAEVVAYHDRVYGRPLIGQPTTIAKVLATTIVAADGKRYCRGREKYLISAGHYGGTTLMPVTDPRVRAVMAHAELAEVANLAENLKNLPVRDAVDVHDRLVQLRGRVARAVVHAAKLAELVEDQ